MKKLFVGVFALIISTGAMAQFHGYYHGGFYRPHVGVAVGVGFPVGYPYYGPYYGPGPYYNNSTYYDTYPDKLDLKIKSIKNKYYYRRDLVKHDKQLSHKEKKREKKQLKYERDQAIIQAKQDFYTSVNNSK